MLTQLREAMHERLPVGDSIVNLDTPEHVKSAKDCHGAPARPARPVV